MGKMRKIPNLLPPSTVTERKGFKALYPDCYPTREERKRLRLAQQAERQLTERRFPWYRSSDLEVFLHKNFRDRIQPPYTKKWGLFKMYRLRDDPEGYVTTFLGLVRWKVTDDREIE